MPPINTALCCILELRDEDDDLVRYVYFRPWEDATKRLTNPILYHSFPLSDNWMVAPVQEIKGHTIDLIVYHLKNRGKLQENVIVKCDNVDGDIPGDMEEEVAHEGSKIIAGQRQHCFCIVVNDTKIAFFEYYNKRVADVHQFKGLVLLDLTQIHTMVLVSLGVELEYDDAARTRIAHVWDLADEDHMPFIHGLFCHLATNNLPTPRRIAGSNVRIITFILK